MCYLTSHFNRTYVKLCKVLSKRCYTVNLIYLFSAHGVIAKSTILKITGWLFTVAYCHRELQSSLYKRHLWLIVWLSMNMGWLKSVSSLSPLCFLPALPPSPPPPPPPLPSHLPLVLWTLQPWKFKGKIARHQSNADEKSKLSGSAEPVEHHTAQLKPPECKSSSVDN